MKNDPRFTWGEVKRMIDEHIDDNARIGYIDISPLRTLRGSADFDFEWFDDAPLSGAGMAAVNIE